jgi:hypothetical protein
LTPQRRPPDAPKQGANAPHHQAGHLPPATSPAVEGPPLPMILPSACAPSAPQCCPSVSPSPPPPLDIPPSLWQIVGVSSLPPRRALIYDAATGAQLAELDDSAAAALARGGGQPGADRGRGAAAACFGPTGELLLWGTTLWDPRVPVAVHTFDQLSEHQVGGRLCGCVCLFIRMCAIVCM